jgi:hypothetical protein
MLDSICSAPRPIHRFAVLVARAREDRPVHARGGLAALVARDFMKRFLVGPRLARVICSAPRPTCRPNEGTARWAARFRAGGLLPAIILARRPRTPARRPRTSAPLHPINLAPPPPTPPPPTPTPPLPPRTQGCPDPNPATLFTDLSAWPIAAWLQSVLAALDSGQLDGAGGWEGGGAGGAPARAGAWPQLQALLAG